MYHPDQKRACRKIVFLAQVCTALDRWVMATL